MDLIYSLKKYNLKAIIISIFVSFHLFFWDIKFFENYGFRETIAFIYFFLIYDLFKNNFYLLRKNKKNLFIISLFILIIFLHQFINSIHNQSELKLHNILGLLGLYSLLIIIYFYYSLILENLKLIILFFLSIFTISYFFADVRFSSHWEIANLCTTYIQFINNHIFLENSHLGMIFGSIIGYFLYEQKNSNFLNIAFILFVVLIMILFESSATLYLSILISIFLILLFDFNFFFKKILLGFFSVIIFFIVVNFILSKQIHREEYSLWCLNKFSETLSGVKVLSKDKFLSISSSKENIVSSKKIENIEIKKKNGLVDKNIKYDDLPIRTFSDIKILDSSLNFRFNLSTAVIINSLNISYETLKSRPLGWGLNMYESAFDYYMFSNIIIPYFYREVYTLNFNDGSANISKILTEFGWISLIIIPVLFIFLFTKRLSKSQKIFFLCLILTQLVRGAGYFNGGFIFSLIFAFFTVFNFYERKNEK